MCHTIFQDKNIHYPKVNNSLLVGVKKFRVTPSGLLSPLIQDDMGNYKLFRYPLGYRFTTASPVTEQKVIFSISNVEVIRVIAAGMHISPYSPDSIGKFVDYTVCLLVCFYPPSVIFFDGHTVSVESAYLPYPPELIICSDEIKDAAIRSWTVLHQVLNTEGIENVGSSNC